MDRAGLVLHREFKVTGETSACFPQLSTTFQVRRSWIQTRYSKLFFSSAISFCPPPLCLSPFRKVFGLFKIAWIVSNFGRMFGKEFPERAAPLFCSSDDHMSAVYGNLQDRARFAVKFVMKRDRQTPSRLKGTKIP